jgi:hypothetical protein
MTQPDLRHACGICNYPIREEDEDTCVTMTTGEHAHPNCATARPHLVVQ